VSDTSEARHVVVVGGGNAGLCAAISAREQGAKVVLLERAPEPLAGGNSAFTAARYVIQEREMAFWTGRFAGRGPNRTLASKEDVAFLTAANFDGRVDWVDGDADLLPGITLHHVGGHTPGMQVVRVLTEEGWAVVASDASHFYANIDDDRPYAIVHNLPEMYAAFDTIRRLADDPKLIVAGHDPDVLRRYPAVTEALRDRAVRVA